MQINDLEKTVGAPLPSNARKSFSRDLSITVVNRGMMQTYSLTSFGKSIIYIGRDESINDITIASGIVSKQHCRIVLKNGVWFIENNSNRTIPKEGNFVDVDGNVLGTHKGITHYTVGQRKGLGIALGYPAFVKKISNITM